MVAVSISRAGGFGCSSLSRIPLECAPCSPRRLLACGPRGGCISPPALNGAPETVRIRVPTEAVSWGEMGWKGVAAPSIYLFNACQCTEHGRPGRLRLSAELDLTSYSEKPLIASPTNLTPNTRKRTARMAALF